MFKVIFLFVTLSFSISTVQGEKDRKKSNSDCVILLHGLARTKHSMKKMAKALEEEGYFVVNVGYPSRKHPVEYLAKKFLPKGIAACRETGGGTIHFVAHSLGGILVRYYLAHHELPEMGRLVMLSSPNQGSEVVDKLKNFPGFHALNGPAGRQLGTSSNDLPLQLPRPHFDVGVLTGSRSINFILSFLIPGSDDGKVSIERAKFEGMKDFLVLPYSHPFIMKRKKTIFQTIYFLKNGFFKRSIK